MLSRRADGDVVFRMALPAGRGGAGAGRHLAQERPRVVNGALPNLIFPADRSWLVSTLWDDDWSCIGGPAGLVGRFLHHPDLRARPVLLGQDTTPPGHQAY